MATPPQVIGAVLVGGQSRRMGQDKARLQWEGEPLAARVAERLRAVTGRVVFVGGAGRGYEDLGHPWFPDPPGLAGRGPMAGLLAALPLAERVLLLACDLPAIEPRFLRRLLGLAGRHPVAIPLVAGRLQPLCAVYGGAGTAERARASLAVGSGRMSDLLQVAGAITLPELALGPPTEVARQLHNLNDPSALSTITENH